MKVKKSGKNPPHTWLLAGHLPVDSGQVMLIDPCYVGKDFANECVDKPKQTPDYAGACAASLSKANCGMFANNNGESEPLGFCSSTQSGDGIYPVFVQYDKDGRIIRVKIDFADDTHDAVDND